MIPAARPRVRRRYPGPRRLGGATPREPAPVTRGAGGDGATTASSVCNVRMRDARSDGERRARATSTPLRSPGRPSRVRSRRRTVRRARTTHAPRAGRGGATNCARAARRAHSGTRSRLPSPSSREMFREIPRFPARTVRATRTAAAVVGLLASPALSRDALAQRGRGAGADSAPARVDTTNQTRRDALKAQALKAVDSMATFTQQMVDQVFSYGELGMQESETSKYLTGILRKNGFTVQRERRRHAHGVGRAVGLRQAGDRARQRHRRHPAGVAEAGRRLPRRDDRRRARARRGAQQRQPAERHRRARGEAASWSARRCRARSCSSPAWPRS